MNKQFYSYLTGTDRFQSYLYSYPHKTAYRPFKEPVDLKSLWEHEKKSALYLYTHIPFCRMKCAFCNLFTISNPQEDLVSLYLNKLQLEAEVARETLGDCHFSGYAIGGGTPSHLEVGQLDQLFSIYTDTLQIDLQKTPGSFEISPDTITADKLTFLSQRGVQRISIGIQSFIEAEARSVGRMQPAGMIEPLLEKIADCQFPVFNIDLIYGLASLAKAIQFQPTEIFLYPLYVRPLTSLFKKKGSAQDTEDVRTTLYNIGRDFLQANGYVQDSMRLFRRPSVTAQTSTEYSCQEDGMLGLGTNARSYTKYLHYSTEYAVSKQNVAAIIGDYVASTRSSFTTANYGIRLSDDDRKRRYLIKSLLKAQGIDRSQYQCLFTTELYADFPELPTLIEMHLATEEGAWLRLHGDGLGYSDLIGHWLISDPVKKEMREYIQK